MRNLLHFIIRYSKWFLFAFYTLVSIALLVNNNRYRQSVYLTSANAVSGGVYGAWSEVTGYFHLKSINKSLQASNARLQNEVLNLKNEIAGYKTLLQDTVSGITDRKRFDYVSAAVINNNTRHARNFFTINRGLKDGVKPGMGVVDQNGVVGIVNVSGSHMSRVISALNETQHFSVKLKGTPYIGSLSWKGNDPTIAYVEEIPRHAKYQTGDTIVTSGYSTTFPEGIPVGVVLNRVHNRDDSFFSFKVRLLSDFRALSTVRVIKDIYKEEIDSLATFDTATDSKSNPHES
ncbi:MAG: rod shape-determining protein MreC [Candidatus Amulumruptor caecigallinarius]|nr:rod shape-determining protein MreC [Candidatus Amulumruptor caecigallinarius]